MEELATIQKAVSHVPALRATLEMYVMWMLTNVSLTTHVKMEELATIRN